MPTVLGEHFAATWLLVKPSSVSLKEEISVAVPETCVVGGVGVSSVVSEPEVLPFFTKSTAMNEAMATAEIVKTVSILAANTSQPLEKIEKDVDRDFYMNAEEAKAYGLIDQVIAGH